MKTIEIESPDYCPTPTELEPVSNADPQMTYDEFFRECLLKNRPCVFQPGLTEKWESTVNWVSNGAPNFQYMRQRYGKQTLKKQQTNNKQHFSFFKKLKTKFS